MKFTVRKLNKLVYLVVALVIAWFLQDAEADKQRVVYSMAASTSSTSLEQFSSTSSRQLSLKSGSDQWVMVSRVVDGDTLEVMIDDEKQKVAKRFSAIMQKKFKTSTGEIDWPKLVQFNSGNYTPLICNL